MKGIDLRNPSGVSVVARKYVPANLLMVVLVESAIWGLVILTIELSGYQQYMRDHLG